MTDPINNNVLNKNNKYLARLKFLENDRLPTLAMMKDVSTYILPRRGLYTSDGVKPGEKVAEKYKNILNSTATRAARLLPAGMQGGLTSPSRPWFRIRTQERELYNIEDVALWCQIVEDQMYSVYNGSNFYSAVHTLYQDEAGFGQGVLFEEEDPEKVIRFTVCPPGEYCLAANEKGEVDTLYRRFYWPARDIHQRFGDKASDDVKRAVKTPGSYYKWFEIVHVIEPNKDRNANQIDFTNMPYKSVYFEYQKTDKLLSEHGYNEKPFMAPRWSIEHPEVYGEGPAFDALGVTKMLQAMEKTSCKAADKQVDPPLRVPSKWHKRANLLPGGHNYVDANDPKDAIGSLYDVNFDIGQVEAKIQRYEELVERLFFMDLFTLITDRPEMTATEVLERREEKLNLLGPVIENQIHELLDPVMERTFNIMQRRGMIPPPPEALMMGTGLKIDYISLLAQAQKMIGIGGMEAYLEKAERIAAIDPNSVIKTDTDAYLEEMAERVAISPRITRDQEVVEQIRAENAARQKELEEAEMMKEASKDIKNLSQADTEGKNALTDIVEAVSE
ncbi:MAG: phage tail protein [Phycisphaerae bacterium]|nr:phage tail protein [Phycisphaerae bacterium]